MSQRFTAIAPSLWTGEVGRCCRGDAIALAMLPWFAAGKHSNPIGLYYLPMSYIGGDLGIPEGTKDSDFWGRQGVLSSSNFPIFAGKTDPLPKGSGKGSGKGQGEGAAKGCGKAPSIIFERPEPTHGIGPSDGYYSATQKLIELGYLAYDQDLQLVWVVDFARVAYQKQMKRRGRLAPKDNQRAMIASALDELPGGRKSLIAKAFIEMYGFALGLLESAESAACRSSDPSCFGVGSPPYEGVAPPPCKGVEGSPSEGIARARSPLTSYLLPSKGGGGGFNKIAALEQKEAAAAAISPEDPKVREAHNELCQGLIDSAKVHGHPEPVRPRLTSARRETLARLIDEYGMDQLSEAWQGIACSAWHNGAGGHEGKPTRLDFEMVTKVDGNVNQIEALIRARRAVRARQDARGSEPPEIRAPDRVDSEAWDRCLQAARDAARIDEGTRQGAEVLEIGVPASCGDSGVIVWFPSEHVKIIARDWAEKIMPKAEFDVPGGVTFVDPDGWAEELARIGR